MANDIGGEFAKLRLTPLMSLEEFKDCLPVEIKIHLDVRKQRTYTKLQFGQMTSHSLIRVYLRK